MNLNLKRKILCSIKTLIISQFYVITAYVVLLTHQKELPSPQNRVESFLFFLSVLRKSNFRYPLKKSNYNFFFNLKGIQVKLLVTFNIFISKVSIQYTCGLNLLIYLLIIQGYWSYLMFG